MAENVVLAPLATLQNSSIISTVNANNTLITNAFEDCLSLAGNQPNAMQSNLNMNNFQILNLPAPNTVNSPARLIDVVSNPTISIPAFGIQNIKDNYGAVGNGSLTNSATGHDDTLAFQTAATAGGYIYIPPGTYRIVGTINITVPVVFFGSGPATTVLVAASTSAPVFSIGVNKNSIFISNLGINRATNLTAVAGGDGIIANGLLSACGFSNLMIQNQYTGLLLQSAGTGYVSNIASYSNVSHGVYFSNSGSATSTDVIQWIVDYIDSESNGGSGVVLTTSKVASETQVTMGTWSRIFTYKNAGAGVFVNAASAVPIQGFRMSNFFLGSDGTAAVSGADDELYLNTYNTVVGPTQIVGGFVELAGGNGVNVTANNGWTSLTAISALGNTSNGLLINNGAAAMFNSCYMSGNGTAYTITNNAGSITKSGNSPS